LSRHGKWNAEYFSISDLHFLKKEVPFLEKRRATQKLMAPGRELDSISTGS
jgi:hypothetical protein